MENKNQDIASKTGNIICTLLQHYYTPNAIHTTPKTMNEMKELIMGYKEVTESEFIDIMEGLKNSLFGMEHCDGKEDRYRISFAFS